MGLVNVSADVFVLFAVRSSDTDSTSVRDAEKLAIPGVDEADTLLGIGHVLVEPVLVVAVDIEVVIFCIGTTLQEVGIVFTIYPEAKPALIFGDGTGHIVEAQRGDMITVRKLPCFIAETIHSPLQVVLEFRGEPVLSVDEPESPELLFALARVTAEISHKAGLLADLLGLTEDIERF